MEEAQSKNPEIKRPTKKEAPKRITVLKKLDSDAAKVLQSLKDRANKKTFGRKVRDSEIIGLGLSLVSLEHIQHLQNQTLSEKDRLHLAHAEYQKVNGKLTLDQFIGKLIRGEINNKNP